MGAPLIVILLFLKKYVGYNMYKSAQEYGMFEQAAQIFEYLITLSFICSIHLIYMCLGFPRVYRRLLEGLNKSILSPSSKQVVRHKLKDAMRFPNTALTALSENETISFLTEYANQVTTSASKKVPPFVITFSKLVIKQTPFGSILDYVNRFKK
mgnify:CR=1 FL=1